MQEESISCPIITDKHYSLGIASRNALQSVSNELMCFHNTVYPTGSSWITQRFYEGIYR